MSISNIMSVAISQSIRSLIKDKAKTATIISVTTAVFGTSETIKATMKVTKLLEEAEKKKGEELTLKEKAKIAAPEYIVPFSLMGASIGSTIFAQCENQKNLAKLAGVVAIGSAEFKEYRQKTQELVGAAKEKEIRDAIVKDRQNAVAEYNQPTGDSYILNNDELVWFYEPVSGRKFKSTVNKIDSALVEISYDMISEMSKSMNDFLDEMDIPLMYETGDELQWSIDDGPVKLIKPMRSIIVEDRPFILVEFDRPPRYL